MSIKKLTHDEFRRFGFRPEPMSIAIADEKEWYVDEAENVLGIVIRDKIDDDWTYVVLGRDTDGKFKWIAGDTSISSQDQCRQDLHTSLADFRATGQSVFNQDKPDW